MDSPKKASRDTAAISTFVAQEAERIGMGTLSFSEQELLQSE